MGWPESLWEWAVWLTLAYLAVYAATMAVEGAKRMAGWLSGATRLDRETGKVDGPEYMFAGFYRLDRFHNGIIWLLMAAAAVYIGLMMVGIVYITIFRTFGWSYETRVFPLIEYGFIYCLFLGSPWLVRHRGHVYIELLTAAVPAVVRDRLSRLIVLVCAVFCLVWVWFTWGYFNEQLEDLSAYDELYSQLGFRTWFSTLAFPIGFLLLAVEFLRYMVVRDAMHIGEAGVASDRSELEETKRSLEEGR